VPSGSGLSTRATEKASMTSIIAEPPSREMPLDYTCSDSSLSGDDATQIYVQSQRGD
jgi:hypothetical protein